MRRTPLVVVGSTGLLMTAGLLGYVFATEPSVAASKPTAITCARGRSAGSKPGRMNTAIRI